MIRITIHPCPSPVDKSFVLHSSFLLLAFLLLCCACSRDKVRNALATIPVKVLQVGEVSEEAVVDFPYVGAVEASGSPALSFSAGGRVKAVFVRDGQHVAQGQLLAQIEDASAVTSLRAAQASLSQAEDAAARAEMVHSKGSMPEVQWVEIQTKLSQAQALAQLAQQHVDDCKLFAPCAGIIADCNLSVGGGVAPFEPVMRILNSGGICITISVPEADIAHLPIGTPAQVCIPALDNRSFSAVVSERNPSADPITHTYQLRLRLSSSGAQISDLLPGMYCKVSLGKQAQSSGFTIPSRAVLVDNDGKRFVYVADGDTARPAYVSISHLATSGVTISEGLSSGDQVIVSGMQKLSSGSPVQIK